MTEYDDARVNKAPGAMNNEELLAEVMCQREDIRVLESRVTELQRKNKELVQDVEHERLQSSANLLAYRTMLSIVESRADD